MWDTIELYQHAFRKLQEAKTNDNQKIEIVLCEGFTGNDKELHSLLCKLQLKTVTENLRKEFHEYTIKSYAGTKFSQAIAYKSKGCDFFYDVVWTLQLKKK